MMSVFEDEIVSTLMEFDLDETDAFLYLALLQMGPTTVNALSVKLDIEKSKVYRSLHRMQNFGIITTTFCNPTICTAVDPHTAFSLLIEKKNEQVLSMQKMLKKITTDITKIQRHDDEDPQVPSFYIIQGRTNIYTRIGKMIQESSGPIYIAAPFSDVRRMIYTAIPDKIKSYREKGGTVSLITDASQDEVTGDIRLNCSDLKITTLPSRGRVIVSEDSLILSGNVSTSMKLNDETDTAFYTNSRGIIDNMLVLCKYMQGDPTSIILHS